MRLKNIGECKTIHQYVKAKYERFTKAEKTFDSIFALSFSDPDNLLWEKREGFRVVRFTYGDTERNIRKLTAVLSRHAAPGGTVALYMENCLEWIELFWAILLSGNRPLLLNSMLPDEVLETALSIAGAKAVISFDKTFRNAARLGAGELLREAEAAEVPAGFDHPSGDGIYLMSSGTTGSPKLCLYTAEEIYWQISYSYQIICANRRMPRHDRGELKHLAFLPFYHIFGLTAVFLWFSFFSRSFVFLNDRSGDTILQTVRRSHVTHIFAVPLLWNKIYEGALKKIASRGEKTRKTFEKALNLAEKLYRVPPVGRLFSKVAFREVRENLFGDGISFLISGGGAVSPEVLRFFNLIGYHLVNGYGMTETGICSVELSLNLLTCIKGSVGSPLQSVEYRISPEGELEIRGRVLARKIFRDDGAEDRSDGFFRTGDLAREEKGKYYILGRTDDLMVGADGENLNPELIEPLLKFPEAMNLSLCADGTGQPALVVQIPRYCGESQAAAIRARAEESVKSLGFGSRIRRIILTEDDLIGKNDFKVSRSKLRQRLCDGSLKEWVPEKKTVSGDGISDGLLLRVREIIREGIPGLSELPPDNADFFSDLGGTSLDYFQTVADLCREFDVDFPSEEGCSFVTAEELADYVRRNG